MFIPNFSKLLDSALKGDQKALDLCNYYIKHAVFSDTQISMAIEVFNAQSENSNALFLLGLKNEHNAENKNLNLAIDFFKKAIKLGNSNAMFHLATLKNNEHYVVISPEERLQLLEEASKLNHIEAQYELGNIYGSVYIYGFEYEDFKTSDKDKALEFYLKAAKLNHAKAAKQALQLSEDEVVKQELLKQIQNLDSDEVKFEDTVKRLYEATYPSHSYLDTLVKFEEGLEKFKQKIKELEVSETGYGYTRYNDSVLQKITANLKKNIEIANKLKHKELKPIYNSINALEKHFNANRPEVLDFARKLSTRFDDFIIYALGTNLSKKELEEQYEDFKKEFDVLLHSKDKDFEKHRKEWKPLIANVALAVTVIGLVAIIIKVCIHAKEANDNKKPFSRNQALFWYKTQSQKHLEKIQDKTSDKLDIDWDTERKALPPKNSQN
jgi:TPR repeat protein